MCQVIAFLSQDSSSNSGPETSMETETSTSSGATGTSPAVAVVNLLSGNTTTSIVNIGGAIQAAEGAAASGSDSGETVSAAVRSGSVSRQRDRAWRRHRASTHQKLRKVQPYLYLG